MKPFLIIWIALILSSCLNELFEKDSDQKLNENEYHFPNDTSTNLCDQAYTKLSQTQGLGTVPEEVQQSLIDDCFINAHQDRCLVIAYKAAVATFEKQSREFQDQLLQKECFHGGFFDNRYGP